MATQDPVFVRFLVADCGITF